MGRGLTRKVSIILIFFLIFTNVSSYIPIAKASTDQVKVDSKAEQVLKKPAETTSQKEAKEEQENNETLTADTEESATDENEPATDNKEEETSKEENSATSDENTNPKASDDNDITEEKEESTTEPTEKEEKAAQKENSEKSNQDETDSKSKNKEEREDQTTKDDKANKAPADAIDFQTLPELLITELMPNNSGTDQFEYFEVYNNSDQAVMLDYYTIALQYTNDDTPDSPFTFPNVSISPGQTLVFWNNNNNLTIEQFNEHYQADLTTNDIVMYEGTNLYNSGQRGVALKDGEEVMVSVSYLAEDIASGKVVNYQYSPESTEMLKYQKAQAPTPGTIESAQVPEQSVTVAEHQAPVIEHTPVSEAEQGHALTIEASISDDKDKRNATLYYRMKDETEFQPISLEAAEGNRYLATIEAEKVTEGVLEYYISATDSNHRVRVPEENGQTFQLMVESTEETEEDFQHYPPLLITEISPNTAGGGTDYFEYFELYNNTDSTLSLNQYAQIYYYTDSGEEVSFQVPSVEIESQETLVFWYNNGNHTLDDFNQQFATKLSEQQLIEVTDDNFPGFSNGGERALIIRDVDNEQVIYADYLGEDNDNNGGVIQYKYPYQGTEMVKWESLAKATPGTVMKEQVPANVVEMTDEGADTNAPEISHEPVSSAEAFSSVKIEANISDDKAIPNATLYVKNKTTAYKSFAMESSAAAPNQYTATIPGELVEGDVTYYIAASDGTNQETTDEFTIAVQQPEVDTESLPPLLVTEVVPDSTNVGSADGYEYIEVYNNTNQAIPFEHYKMQYRYGTDPESDIIWPSIPDDLVIPAGEILVFWIINGQNNDKTVADFNANYGSQLEEDKNIVRIESAGMANGSMRGLIVASNVGTEHAVAYYNDEETKDDTTQNKGIVYKFPTDGSNQMEKVSSTEKEATPGVVEAYQIPSQPVSVEIDQTEPQIKDITYMDSVTQTNDLDIKAEVSDQEELKTVAVYYRTNHDETFHKALLEEGEEQAIFTHRIYAPEMVGNETVEYYFEASDGTNLVKTDVKTVTIENDLDTRPVRLNVKEKQILSDTFVLKGTSTADQPENVRMKIDGNQVEKDFQAVEHTAYFAFEVSGVNTYFQNGVTIGDQVVSIFDDWIAQWETITVPIDPSYFEVGDNTITIRAGNKASPWEGDPGENRDDYNLRNVRLVLADGTVLTDASHQDPEQVLDMGDDGTERIAEDFTFTVSKENAQSFAHEWDTTKVADGEHQIEVADSNDSLTTKVLVDNTAPMIETTIENNESYKGEFTIDAMITDEVAGVETIKTMLDGDEIELPHEAATGTLTPGKHVLSVTATDKAGNTTERELTFFTEDENPNDPTDESSITDGDPKLKVRVEDPTADKVDVGFYQGYQYTPADTDNVTSYLGASPTEPPNTNDTADAKRLSSADITSVSEKDGDYLVTNDTTKFPYHRFDVTLDETIDDNDTVELAWTGHSLEGRKVSMYAWNIEAAQWDLIDYKIAGDTDFDLKGTVKVSSYSENHQIQVMIQDEIPSSNEDYDYTFAWLSDTQYYSESYPHIYDRQTDWIVEKQEEMKIEYVFHSGDLVDEADKEEQWLNADGSMRKLDDANIPYGVLAGNHDVLQKTEDYTEYYKYFGEDRFADESYYGGSYLNNRGHYDLISTGGNDYIMVYLGWGIDDDGIAWINQVLSEHPGRTAILTFHEYLQATGSRHPLGEKLYQEVVLPNENVVAVLSGHYHEAQTLVDDIDDDGDGETDRQVYQILADYQAGPEGGQGYMRLLHFDTDNNRVLVNTYSPYLDDYNYYDTDEYPNKDEFVINMDLEAKEKQVATDYFAVNVYTDNEIDTVENVESGQTAEVTWTGLTEGERYFWYVNLMDDYTGTTRSSIFSFVKGEDTDGEVDPEPDQDKDHETDPGSKSEADQESGSDTKPTPVPDDDNDNQPTEKQTADKDKTSVNNDSDYHDSAGNNLPETATNIFKYLLFSMIILSIGMVLLLIRDEKVKA
ncbi:lamin tail domain-containing protein [Gracilibacillus caseinilyticus]|uniref:Lamin tail domain-containing protein n=1 Tax=Gracilibacillus caseinilyticus TaxID=2932256 RepID=A0ABY4ERH0_9BACI|nr:lamin tail domain-containing protein [Gracilibacillus caseinilyticus]UOQ46681.1 lamin tail domain-containing protein [Gracilibacillus caseinilyticus]